ncbi:MAG: SpaA isopeptide-forming pilin-related protein [Blautia obeum]
MKLIKKIAAIMLSVMMVLGMASVVSAEGTTTSGAYNNTTGTITIDNAIVGQTYTIYRILKLESFSVTGTTGNYAYKAEDNWGDFIKNTKTSDNENYLVEDASGYVTWNTKVNDNDTCKKEFAKKALAYAKDTKNSIVVEHTPIKAESNTVKFEGISLGYYVVDSSAGTLCSLTTTNPTVTIQEKNGVPSVEKKVQEDSTSVWGDNNTADIGQTVNFQTTITAQSGAQNYVLHDKMDAELTFGINSVQVKLKKNGEETDNEVETSKYEVKNSGLEDSNPCTFHVEFKKEFCDTLKADDKIIVTYSATLDDDAVPKTEYKNETWLKYGDNNETNHGVTKTKTFELPVFKYTKDGTDEKALAGATFTLSKNQNGTDPINLVKTSAENAAEGTYRVARTGETGVTTVTTPSSGKFTIKGLDADTYYLTETKQPDGYNKLSAPIKVVIAENGNITIGTDTTVVTEVKVLNNTGTILPSTGGNGTSLIYFLGAVLALVSGVVLITKQRMKNN